MVAPHGQYETATASRQFFAGVAGKEEMAELRTEAARYAYIRRQCNDGVLSIQAGATLMAVGGLVGTTAGLRRFSSGTAAGSFACLFIAVAGFFGASKMANDCITRKVNALD